MNKSNVYKELYNSITKINSLELNNRYRTDILNRVKGLINEMAQSEESQEKKLLFTLLGCLIDNETRLLSNIFNHTIEDIGEVQENEFFTAEEVANKLSVNVETIRRYIKQGKIKALFIGKAYKIKKDDFYFYLQNNYKD